MEDLPKNCNNVDLVYNDFIVVWAYIIFHNIVSTRIVWIFCSFSGILSAYGLAMADVVHEVQEPCAKIYSGNFVKKHLSENV